MRGKIARRTGEMGDNLRCWLQSTAAVSRCAGSSGWMPQNVVRRITQASPVPYIE